MHRPGPDPYTRHLILQSVDPTTAWRKRDLLSSGNPIPEDFQGWLRSQQASDCESNQGINSKSSKRFSWIAGPSGTKHNYIVDMGQILLSGTPQFSLNLKKHFDFENTCWVTKKRSKGFPRAQAIKWWLRYQRCEASMQIWTPSYQQIPFLLFLHSLTPLLDIPHIPCV